VHHLIKGLQFFRDSGIVHNDLKPQNILYDTKTNKLMFIDFGLMQTKKELIRTSKNNTNNQAVFHWSYPLDSGFMDYNAYSKYKRGITNGYRKLVKDELIGMLVSDSKKNTAKLPLKRPEAFELFFSYINLTGKDMTTDAKYAFIESFFDGLDEMVTLEYDDYLDDAIDSIDVYGLGFTLQYILNCFKRHNAVSQDFFNFASSLFFKMYDPNPDDRELNIYELLDEYESILLGTGVLTRLNKRFNDNELVDSAPMPSPIMRKAKKEDKSGNPLSEELESIAYMDAEPATKSKATTAAKATLTLKPATAKPAIAKPAIAKVTLRPTTAKPATAKETLTSKVCPPGKELNPKTGRCIKKCGPNETRNAQGRCVKKTRRMLSKTHTSKTRSSSSKDVLPNNPTPEELMEEIFPELKKTTPKLLNEKTGNASYNTLMKQANKQLEPEPEIKINKTFPYENRSKTSS
jgi:serine/threonine protein kinase